MYNNNMLTSLPNHDNWKKLLGAMRMNQYRANWPVVLDALRHLWKTGKSTKLETPLFEPFRKSANK